MFSLSLAKGSEKVFEQQSIAWLQMSMVRYEPAGKVVSWPSLNSGLVMVIFFSKSKTFEA